MIMALLQSTVEFWAWADWRQKGARIRYPVSHEIVFWRWFGVVFYFDSVFIFWVLARSLSFCHSWRRAQWGLYHTLIFVSR